MACRLVGAKPLSEPMMEYSYFGGNKFQWNLKQNSYIFIQGNAFENVVCKKWRLFRLGLSVLKTRWPIDSRSRMIRLAPISSPVRRIKSDLPERQSGLWRERSVHGRACPILRTVILRIGRDDSWTALSCFEPDALATRPDVFQRTGLPINVCCGFRWPGRRDNREINVMVSWPLYGMAHC